MTSLATFAREPIAPHSAQFPLPAGPHATTADEEPSPPGVRPWNLRALTSATPRRNTTTPGVYDHQRQIQVTPEGRPHTLETDASADSVTNLDGDEGTSEDWKYDYCPDNPTGV